MEPSEDIVTTAESLLLLKGVDTFHGQAQVLFAADLEVRAGEAVALMGRNGAGKSALLQTIGGMLPPAKGSIRFDGREIAGRPPHKIARLGVGTVPEGRRIFADLTVAENLEVGRRPMRKTQLLVDIIPLVTEPDQTDALGQGQTAWTVERLLGLFPDLAPLMDRRGDSLSGGEQQMLAIARTLMGNPRLLLLDEPAEGLSPPLVAQTSAAVRAIKAEGVAILLSEQNPAFAAGLVDRTYMIERGQVRAV